MGRPSNNQQSAPQPTDGTLESADRSKEQTGGAGGEGGDADKDADSGAPQQGATSTGEGASQVDLTRAEGTGAADADDAEEDSPPPPVVSRRHERGVISAVVAKGRTVQDVDGTNRKAGESVRVPASDHGRLLDLGFLAKTERQIVASAPKKGPSITRGRQ